MNTTARASVAPGSFEGSVPEGTMRAQIAEHVRARAALK